MAQYNNPYGQQYAQYPGVATTPFQTVSVPTSTVSQVGSSQYNTPYLGTTGQYIVQTNPNLSQLQSVFQQTQTSSYQQPTTQSYQIPTATTYQQSAYHTTTGAYQQPSAYQHHYAQHPQQIAQPLPLNANFTNNAVWMGDIDSWMDENFIYSLFAHTGELVNVKLIRDKQTGTTANYCFVYFTTPLAAQKVIENFNGQPIPGTSKVFKLNWAQFGAGKTSQQQQKVEKPVVPVPMKKPPSGSEEVISLFVGDLAPDVTDYMILSTFQYYYPSCYSAKVVTDPNTGMSKGYGFVYFHDENDKARALTEMQGYYLSYRPIRLNIATKKGETKPSTQGTQPPIEQQQLKSPQHAGPQPKPQHSTQKQEVDPSNTTVFVGAIDHTINHHVLTAFFQPFGEIVQIKTPLGKGCAFIEYTTHEAAKKVLETFNGNALIGTCQVRLSWGRPSKSSSQTQPQSTEKTEQSTDKTETSDKPEISDKTEATVAPTTEEYVPEPVAVLTTNEEYVPGQETVITTTSNPEEIQIQFNEPVEQPTTEQSEQSVQNQQAEINGDQETTEQPQEQTEVQTVGEEITSTKTDNGDSTIVESAEQKETVDTEQSQLEKRPAEEEEEHPAKKRKTEEELSS